ncbi:hypothetical protein [Dactylosporangium sp. CA-139066]|uniref:hypothetical protein n=1 Tax=Dactylosporangium sp. CA-139066 TaxID=3239930 RepID=UPI003D8BBC69
MRLSGAAGEAVRLAAQRAWASGADRIDGALLLAGLAGAEGGARHALGAFAEALRPPVQGAHGAQNVSFAEDAREAIEAAARRATANGRRYVTSIDLLDGVLGTAKGAGALRAAGADPAGLASGDHDACCPESVPSHAEAALAEVVRGAGKVRRRAWVAGLAGRVALMAGLYAIVLAIAWDTAGPEIILAGGGGAVVVALGVAAVRVRGATRRLATNPAPVVPLPADAGPLLERLGLRSLEVRVGGGFATDRCYRRGRRAWIFVSEHTDHDAQRVRFVLWHEVAHLARRDSRGRIVTGLLGLGLLTGVMLSFDPRAMLVAGIGAPALAIAWRWWAEAACDRFAVRQVGGAALRAWAADHLAVVATLRRRRQLPKRLGRRTWLSHPPMRLRAALHRVWG